MNPGEASKSRIVDHDEPGIVISPSQGSKIQVVLNGEPVIGMDLDQWTQAGQNPDGTPNKFKTAYKDMARCGRIGFQDHGSPVWYRNVRIRPLGK